MDSVTVRALERFSRQPPPPFYIMTIHLEIRTKSLKNSRLKELLAKLRRDLKLMRMNIAVKSPESAVCRRFAEYSSLQRFIFIQISLFPQSTFPRPPVFVEGYDRQAAATQ
jgi:hypothetical protein